MTPTHLEDAPDTAGLRSVWSRLHAWGQQHLARQGRMDRWVLLLTLLLVSFGLVMVYSASAVIAAEDNADALYYLKRQAVAVAVGLGGMTAMAWIPSRFFCRYALSFYVAALVGLCLVFVPGLSESANGATRWIRLGSFHVQPSEFAKLALALVLAARISRDPGRLGDLWRGVLPTVAYAVPLIFLVMKEPDFGTSAILAGILGLLLLLGGIPGRWMAVFTLVGTAAAVPMVAFSGYRMDRFRSWLDPWAAAESEGYQVIQSWVALYSGGWMGQGLGNSLAKLRFLPEPWTDFVAAVVGEELGFLGLLFLLVCYGLIAWRGVVIAGRSRTYFGMLVAGCITAVLGTQALLNLSVVLGLVPPKGLVLPFISYGGSAIIAQLWSIGLLLSISVERRVPRGRPQLGQGSGAGKKAPHGGGPAAVPGGVA